MLSKIILGEIMHKPAKVSLKLVSAGLLCFYLFIYFFLYQNEATMLVVIGTLR